MTEKSLLRYSERYPDNAEVQNLVKTLRENLKTHDELQQANQNHPLSDDQKHERILVDRELIRLKMLLHDEVHAIESAKNEDTQDFAREMQFHAIEMNRENLKLQSTNKDTQVESLKIQRWLAYVAIISLLANAIALGIAYHSNLIANSALEEAIEANRINRSITDKNAPAMIEAQESPSVPANYPSENNSN